MRLIDRLNQEVLHPFFARRIIRTYKADALRIGKAHPELFKQIDGDLVARHRKLWGVPGFPCDDLWIRYFVNLTGVQDHAFCPPGIFYAWIERILNDSDTAGSGPEEKNDLWRYLPAGYEPEVVLRYIRGNFYDKESKWISPAAAQSILDAEPDGLVGKPCRSCGGNGVALFMPDHDGKKRGNGHALTVDWIARQSQSYVVQRKLKQDEFGASFNASSINTVRLVALRRPWDGRVVVCRAIMRMGVRDVIADNMSQGGICVPVDKDGKLNDYALDYDGARIERHPTSGIVFKGLYHPHFIKMAKAADEILSQLPFYSMMSFDFIAREDGSICCVEMNARSQGIIQSQYGFGGLFGEDSERLVDWCTAHQDLDSFKHLRSWY